MLNRSMPFCYDYERCNGEHALQQLLNAINDAHYELISVTQYEHTYTVFFRRPFNG